MDETYLWIMRIAFGAYVLLLVAAALFDLKKFIIPNYICLAVLVLFVPTALLLPLDISWLSHLGAALAVLVVGLVIYNFGWLGAGDVKLLTAVSIWMGFEKLPTLLIYVSIAGGVFAIGLLAFRRILMGLRVSANHSEKIAIPRVLLVGEAIPYGVAIAIGSIITATQVPLLGRYLSF